VAGSAIVGILRALLVSNAAEFNREVESSSKALKAFSRDAGRMGQQLTNIGRTATTAFTLPIIAGGAAAASLAISFESSFAGVLKTVEATETELATLAQGFRDLSKEIPISVNELNGVGEAAGQLGIATQNILGFTETMSLLGVTTNLSAQEAATSLARFANITGLAQTDFDSLGSTIVSLGNSFATTEQEIVEMGLRLAGAGTQIGLTEAQILGLATALSSVGIRAEAGGTALSRVMIEIASSVDSGGEALSNFADVALPGVNDAAAKFAKLFKEDAGGALEIFIEGLGKVEDGGASIFAVLEDLSFGGIRVRDSMLRLANAGDITARAFDNATTAFRENSALTEEAQKRFETTEAQLTLLWNRIKDVGITLGNALLPMIKRLIDIFNRLIPILEGAANLFANMPVGLQLTAVGFLAIVAAAGPVLLILGQLAFAVQSLTLAFTANGIASVGLLGPLARIGPLLSRSFPTFIAWGAALGGVFTVVAGKMGFFTRMLGGMLLSLKALGPAALVAGAAIGGWKIGKWISDVTGLGLQVQILWGKLLGVSEASIRASDESRRLGEALQRERDGFADLSATLEALAAKDIAGFTNATVAAKLAAQELADNLPFAVIQVENLAKAATDFANKGKLTPSVMREIATQARGLKTQVGELPPVLENLVTWLNNTTEAAEEVAGDDGGGLPAAKTAAEEYKEALDRLLESIGGGQAFQAANLWLDAIERIGGATNLTKEEQAQATQALSSALAKYNAMGIEAPFAILTTLDALRLLRGEQERFDTTQPGKFFQLPPQLGGDLTGLFDFQLPPAFIADTFRPLREGLSDFFAGAGSIITSAILEGNRDQIGAALGSSLGNIFAGIGADQLGEGALGQALGGAMQVAAPIAASIFFDTFGRHTTGAFVASGAVLGATIGTAILPGIGTAIGAGIGAIAGFFRGLGRSLADNIEREGETMGFALTDGFIDALGQQSDRFGKDAGAALMANLSAAIEDSGGVLAVGLERSIALVHDLFSFFERGQITTEELGEQFNLTFAQILPFAFNEATGEMREDFKELIELATEFGVESENLAAFFEAIGEKLDDVIEKRKALLAEVARDGAAALNDLVESGFVNTKNQVEVAGRAAVAMFNQLIASGLSFAEVIEILGPAIGTIADRARALGIDLGPTFQILNEGATLFADEGLKKIFDRAVAAGDVLRALTELGVVAQQDFNVLGNTIGRNFDRLVAGGLSGEAALQALRPQIALLIRLQDEYGFSVSASTQEIIDQGRAAGISGEEAKSAAEKQLEAFDKMILALQQIVVLLGGTIDEAGRLDRTEINPKVTFEVDDSQLRTTQIPDFVNVPVTFVPTNTVGGVATTSAKASGGSISSSGSFRRQFGSPNLDFEDFGQETEIRVHRDEAIIPRGGGHDLAEEIATALGPMIAGGAAGGGGVTLQVQDGAIRIEGLQDAGEAILDGLTRALTSGGRPVTRLIGTLKAQTS